MISVYGAVSHAPLLGEIRRSGRGIKEAWFPLLRALEDDSGLTVRHPLLLDSSAPLLCLPRMDSNIFHDLHAGLTCWARRLMDYPGVHISPRRIVHVA
jgi:hypothetical protein